MLTLILWNAGILKAVEEGMLAETAVKKRRSAPMNSTDKDKVVAPNSSAIHPNTIRVGFTTSIPTEPGSHE